MHVPDINVPDILKIIGEQIQACASGKLAYAEPVSVADRMVIPVAWVRYDFGAGGGGGGSAGYARMAKQGGEGGGGGGQVSVVPVGLVEITPTGTRFIPIPDGREIFALVASSFGSQTGMNKTETPETGNKKLAAAKTPTKQEVAAFGGASRGTAKKAATKGSIPLAKKAAAKAALSKKTAPVKASVKKKAPSAATKKSAAKRR